MNKIKTIFPFTYTWLDYPDNFSYSLSIFCIGCDNDCNGCQTPKLRNHDLEDDFNIKLFDIEEFEREIEKGIIKTRSDKICFIGGDFLSSRNINFTKEFLQRNRAKYEVCIYTGHDINYVKKNEVNGFAFIKCNKFDIDKKQESIKTDDLIQLASSNQELYDSEYNLLSKNGIYYFK
jgi:organic radical activating enzyme